MANEATNKLDEQDEVSVSRARSMKLLGTLVRPVRKQMLWLGLAVIGAQLALVAGPWLIARAIDVALPELKTGNSAPALLVGGGYIVAGIVAALLTHFYIRFSTSVGQKMLLDLRGRVFRHTQRLSLSFHERYTSGRVIARQTSDMETLRELLEQGVQTLAASALGMLFTIVSILLLDVKSGILILLMQIPAVLVSIWYQKKATLVNRKIRTYNARAIVKFVETFNGIRAVKSFRTEHKNLRTYQNINDKYQQSTVRGIHLFGIYLPALDFIGTLTVTALLLWGGLRVIEGDLQVGVLLALILYARRFFEPIMNLAGFYSSLQSAIAAVEKIASLLDEDITVAEPKQPLELTSAEGDLKFTDVSFRYTPDSRQVLKPLNLHIPAGQTVALVGKTGAGKTTIAKLLARFYDPSTGSIQLDGVDIRDLSASTLSRHIVMVTQEAYLFQGTIGDNIALGKPDASDAEIKAAASAIGADRFIEALPDGYETDIFQRGGRVSAGQRQLISFARAFLADPAVLILDEATSSLDMPSERLVQAGLTKLLGERTSIIIAHRLSTVMVADRVLVLHDGTVVEDGSPAELVAAGGRFAALYNAWQKSLTLEG